jgi:general secretion pathway protein I
MANVNSGRRGFTLLEVLVALAVMAIAMAALWKGLGQGIAVSEGLPERIMARWIAQNHMVLRQARGDWPDTRTYNGTEEMGGREWYWQEQVTDTEEPQMRRITVQVGRDATSFLFTLEGYLQRPGQGLRIDDGQG